MPPGKSESLLGCAVLIQPIGAFVQVQSNKE